MPKRDYYNILGIARDATRRQIKNAFHKLAMMCHPDRNPDDPEAERQFKELSEAYQVLICDNQREQYDLFGHDADRFADGSGFETVEDIFNQFSDAFGDVFGFDFGQKKPKGPQAGEDIKHTLELTFEEAAFGTTKIIRLTRQVHCKSCEGSGAQPGTEPTQCSACHGSGQISHHQGLFAVSSTCHVCHGRGILIEHPCQDCRGRGTRRCAHKIQVKIPPGVNTGTKLKVSNEGALGDPGTKRGDLFVILHVLDSDLFERDGLDLHFYANISYIQAALGCDINVPGLNEPQTITIPPGTQHEDTFELVNCGIRHPSKKQRFGNMYIHIMLQNAPPYNEEQRKLLEQLAESLQLPLDIDLT